MPRNSACAARWRRCAAFCGARRGLRRAGGFTLLELLVVVVILAVLAGLVAPAIGGQRGRRVDVAAERMVALVNQARQEAVLSARVWRLELDPERRIYRFDQRVDGHFEPVAFAPFAGAQSLDEIAVTKLAVNGEAQRAAGTVELLPTGEQDAFAVVLGTGAHTRRVVMDVVGTAALERTP